MTSGFPCLYDGVVTHHRHAPVARQFRYRVTMACLDLDTLDESFRISRFASASRAAPLRFRRQDHFGDPAQPLADTVRDTVEHATDRRPGGPVLLLTHLRHLGYVFNPLSLHFCFGLSGRVESVVAEVSNTPWGERHCYVLSPSDAGDGTLCATNPKEFHVSPFLPMDLDYDWRIAAPSETCRVEIACSRRGERVFGAVLSLRRRAWTAAELRRTLLRSPLLTRRIFAAIHWQALRIWLARVPVHEHPGGVVPRGGSPAEPRA